MEGKDRVISSKAYKVIDKLSVKTKLQQVGENKDKADKQDIKSESHNLDLEEAPPETEKRYLAPKVYRTRGRRGRKRLNTKLQSQAVTPQKQNTRASVTQPNIGPKYRPIRPKPFISSISVKNKLLEIPWNINSNPLIVTASLPNKDKVQDVTAQDSSKSKTGNLVKLVGDNVKVVTKQTNDDKKSGNSNAAAAVKKDTKNIKSSCKSPISGIELFFESMAQAVLNLPTHVQAEIKMEICKLVTMAEIKYCGSQSRQKTD